MKNPTNTGNALAGHSTQNNEANYSVIRTNLATVKAHLLAGGAV
jgi:hypothetical protein